jgi:hypothetical protein
LEDEPRDAHQDETPAREEGGGERGLAATAWLAAARLWEALGASARFLAERDHLRDNRLAAALLLEALARLARAALLGGSAGPGARGGPGGGMPPDEALLRDSRAAAPRGAAGCLISSPSVLAAAAALATAERLLAGPVLRALRQRA